MRITTLVLTQRANQDRRRWFWHAVDSHGHRSHESSKAGGWERLDRCTDNAEGILGAEIELYRDRGRYAGGLVVGRSIVVTVDR